MTFVNKNSILIRYRHSVASDTSTVKFSGAIVPSYRMETCSWNYALRTFAPAKIFATRRAR